MPPKGLFESDSDDDDINTVVPVAKKANIKVNEVYASKYEQVKRKQELQRLTDKYGADVAAGSSGDEDEEDDEDYGSEDDDAHYLTQDKELAFAEVFHKIRTQPDEIIKDKNTRFFPTVEDDSTVSTATTSTSGPAFRLKDEFQRKIGQIAAVGDEVEEEAPPADDGTIRKIKPKTAAEKKLRDAFLNATKQSAEEFDVKLVSKAPKQQSVPETKVKANSLLHAAFSAGNAKNNSDEKFLERFFVDELWRGNGEDDDSDKEYDWEAMAKEEQDEQFFDEAEQWEREFQDKQFRHEDGAEALTIQTFPRQQQEGTLRKKSSTRKLARERREERKEEETTRQVEELKRLKTLKRKEIEEQQSLIAKVAGIKNLAKLGITKEFLEKDFDPVEFDKKMAAIFDHEYDHDIDDDEIALFEDDLDVEVPDVEDPDADIDPDEAAAAVGSDVDDDFADTLEESIVKAKKHHQLEEKAAAGKKSKKPSFLQDDDLAMLYPDEAIKELEELPSASLQKSTKASVGAVTGADLEKELEKKMDEYWKLHYHKVAGDVRTRFRYRDVNPETFGLTDADVLTKDDRQLNMIVPLNCYATYLGKNENQRDRYKAMHRKNSLREIASDRKSRRYGDVKKTAILDPDIDEAEGEEIAAKIREGAKRLRGADDTEDTHGPQRKGAKERRVESAGNANPKASTVSSSAAPVQRRDEAKIPSAAAANNAAAAHQQRGPSKNNVNRPTQGVAAQGRRGGELHGQKPAKK